ncbi:hypothetical protein [Streptomyces sp. NPDC058247]
MNPIGIFDDVTRRIERSKEAGKGAETARSTREGIQRAGGGR